MSKFSLHVKKNRIKFTTNRDIIIAEVNENIFSISADMFGL